MLDIPHDALVILADDCHALPPFPSPVACTGAAAVRAASGQRMTDTVVLTEDFIRMNAGSLVITLPGQPQQTLGQWLAGGAAAAGYTLNVSAAQALTLLQAAIPAMGTTQPAGTGVLWVNGGFICRS